MEFWTSKQYSDKEGGKVNREFKIYYLIEWIFMSHARIFPFY